MPETLFYRTIPPQKNNGGLAPLLVLLHGRGTDENDLLGITKAFDPEIFVASIRAPLEFEWGGYTWFHLSGEMAADAKSFLSACDRLLATIEEIKRSFPVNPQKVFLCGFSMGTIMSYALALSKPELFAGVIAQSGFVPESPSIRYKWNELQTCSFIAVHGTEDAVLSVDLSRRARDLFSRSNADFTYKEYPMAHEISDESLLDVSTWLSGQLGKKGER